MQGFVNYCTTNNLQFFDSNYFVILTQRLQYLLREHHLLIALPFLLFVSLLLSTIASKNTIAKKKVLLVRVDAEVDAADLKESLQEPMTVDDVVEHINDDIATL